MFHNLKFCKKNSIFILAYTLLLFNILSAHKGGHKQKKQLPSIGVLKGTIIDSLTSTPLQYASVSLIDLDHNELITGGLADANGELHIKNIPLGQYIAVVEFIGYERKEISPINLLPKEKNDIEHDLGQVKLYVSPINISTVEVLGSESQFIQTIDKKIFNVGKSLSASGGTGSDVLRQIPGVDVDFDGLVSIAGDGNVTVLIDGKKSGRTGSGRRAEVERIDASLIDLVEIITNPSAKYDPDGVGGIINIVLVRGSSDGFNGNISSMFGERNKQNTNINFNYKTKITNILVNLNYKKDYKVGDGFRDFIYQYPNKVESINQNTNRIEIPNNLSFRLGTDYYINQSSFVGYTLDIAEHKDITKRKFDYILNTVDPNIIGLFQTENHDDGFHIDHLVSYENRLTQYNQLIKAYVSFSYETDDVNEIGNQNITYNPLQSQNRTEAYENNNNLTLSIDYESKLKDNFNFEIGSKATIRNFKTELSYLNTKYINDFSENIYAAYFFINYDLPNPLGLKLGFRSEQVNTVAQLSGKSFPDSSNIITSIIDSAIIQSPYNNPYFKLYPNFSILYKINTNQTVQLGYSKKVNRPEIGSLSPFPESTQDISRLRNGNPYLKPEFSDIIELKFSSSSKKININSNFSLKSTNNVIMWWDRDYMTFNSKSYEIITVSNAENSESINFSTNIIYRLSSITSIAFWGYGWNSKIYDKGEADFNGNSKGIGYGNRISINFPSLTRLELSTTGRTKMEITTGSLPSNYKTDLGIQKFFLNKKISASFKIADIFNSQKFIIKTKNDIINSETGENYQQILYAERQLDKRFISININYNFGKNKGKKWNKNILQKNPKADMDMDY
jgi:hypothetical protein